MKIADITTPGDYEVEYGGNKRTIVAVETRTRQVFSGDRSDWGGHEATGKVAVDDTGRLYTPQQVLRPWSKAQLIIDRVTTEKDEQDRIIRELNHELNPWAGTARAETTHFGKYERQLGHVVISLTNAQAADLTTVLRDAAS